MLTFYFICKVYEKRINCVREKSERQELDTAAPSWGSQALTATATTTAAAATAPAASVTTSISSASSFLIDDILLKRPKVFHHNNLV